MTSGIESFVVAFTRLFPDGSIYHYTFNAYALFGILLASLVCGSMGGLVVGNRMAFFSDALAHCAFAGFALGIVIFLLTGLPDAFFRQWIALIMVVFGVVVGLLIAFVREQTGLASDTVIGVFFAGAIGLGAVFTPMAARRRFFNIESFIFGDPQTIDATNLIYLVVLLAITATFLVVLYNDLILTSVSPSLALSRNVPVRLCRYSLVVLLGLIVNLCLQVVGVLLINALLIVPAATASNCCRNLRQLFWCSVLISVGTGVGGQIVSWQLRDLQIGTGGTIVVLNVILFVASIFFGPMIRGRSLRAPVPA